MAERERAWRLIAAAAAVGLVLRLLFGLVYWTDKPLTHDEREYLALARSLTDGGGFAYPADYESGTAQRFGRAPAYPMFLAAIGAGTTTSDRVPSRVKIAQAFVGTAVVLVIALIALRAAGAGAGVAAGAIAAVYPPLVWYPAYALSETVYALLALSSVLVLQAAVTRADQARSSRAGGPMALLAGLLAGAAVLTRPAMLLFVPLAVLWLIKRRRPALAVALCATVVAVVAPWTARNYRVSGRFVLVASEGGVTFWTGNHPLARGEGDLAANPAIKRAELEFRQRYPGLTAEELEPLYYRDATRYIAEHPGWWLSLLAKKAFYTVVPIGPSYQVHSLRYRVASVASYLVLLPFALVGLRRLRRLDDPPAALGALVGSAILVCLIFFPQERFRVPVIDPAMIVAAAASRRRGEP